MSAVVAPVRPRRAGRAVPRPAVVALARTETLRMLRNPVLWAGAALSGWLLWSTTSAPETWAGATYQELPTTSAPLMLGISVVVAAAFHRERADVAPTAPVSEAGRSAARFLAALPLVVLAGLFALVVGWRERAMGGLVLGQEPGRTAEALHTSGELSQHVALAVLAVALGAALGRRTSRFVTVVPLLFVMWFVVSIYWLFGDRLAPVSIIQVQPVYVEVGDATANPLAFPSTWLLEGPNDYSEAWSRLVVSATVAWWHVLYLCGLAAAWSAVALPRSPVRARLLVGGLLVAAAAAAVQWPVIW